MAEVTVVFFKGRDDHCIEKPRGSASGRLLSLLYTLKKKKSVEIQKSRQMKLKADKTDELQLLGRRSNVRIVNCMRTGHLIEASGCVLSSPSYDMLFPPFRGPFGCSVHGLLIFK